MRQKVPEYTEFHIALLKAGFTQVRLATLLDLHPSDMSRIVNGWLIPSPERQKAIRKALGEHGRNIKFGYRLPKEKQNR